MNEINIGSCRIGYNNPPFVIAEMSGNHNRSLEKALKIVEEAARTGANALKIQTYTPDTMTLNISEGAFGIADKNSLWRGSSLYDLYKEAYTPWEWHEPIFKRCEELGLICFSTPFDETAVDFLETLNVPCYKIASFENIDIPLIRKVAATKKPIIMSTGMATLGELEEAITAAKEAGCKDIILLKCTSSYPANPENSNIRTIPHMAQLFNCQIGLSDHTLGTGAAVGAVALGATVIEKHFTLSRSEGGVDSAFSMEPHEMRDLVEQARNAWQALGEIKYGPTEKEKASLQFRRSLYITKDIKAGEVLTKENLRSIRPGLGLPPKFMDTVMGKTVARDAKAGTPLTWDLL